MKVLISFKLLVFSSILLGSVLSASPLECAAVNPKIPTECFEQSDPNNFCCFKDKKFVRASSCVSVQKSSYSLISSPANGAIEYVDCGPGAGKVNTGQSFISAPVTKNENKLVLPNQSCGTANPAKRDDCSNYSILNNSCCYFTDSKGNTGCYWLGLNYRGSTKYGEYNLECAAKNIKNNIVLIFFIILSIFLI